MTLIAGYLSHGTPTLVGDMLITRNHSVAGHRKKVHIIADNLAVAWTGDMVAARSVITTLSAKLPKHRVTLAQLKQVLIDPETSELGKMSVILIGWIVDGNERHCFCWNSGYPVEIYFEVPQFAGSGGKIASDRIGINPEGSHGLPIDKFPDSDIRAALVATTNLMRHETAGPSSAPLGFGFAYEVAMYRNDRFAYVDDVLYLSIVNHVDTNGKFVRSEFAGKFVKYHERGAVSELHVYDPATKETHIDEIGPLVGAAHNSDGLRAAVRDRKYKFPFRSKWYCAFARIEAPGFYSPPITEVYLHSDESTAPMHGAEDSLIYRPIREATEALYAHIKADRTREFNERSKQRVTLLGVEGGLMNDIGLVEIKPGNSGVTFKYPLYVQFQGALGKERIVRIASKDAKRHGVLVAASTEVFPTTSQLTEVRYGRIEDRHQFTVFLRDLARQAEYIIFIDTRSGAFSEELISSFLSDLEMTN